jgi:uncharacterized RDD family membrane protein YckC
MVLSSIWDTLGIPHTADIRLIKKAYSNKLKQTRPDEKPEEFQQLHFAYKAALQEVRWLAEQKADNTATETEELSCNITYQTEPLFTDSTLTESSFDTACDIQVTHSESPNTHTLDHSNAESTSHYLSIHSGPVEYQAEIDRILDRVETVITEGSGCDLSSWKIVLESEYILEQDFVNQLGLALLRRIAQYYNNEEFRNQDTYGISVDVLLYLNSIFRWDRYEYDYSFYLQNHFGILQFDNLKNFDEKYSSIKSDATSSLRGAKSIKKVIKHTKTPFKYYYYGSHNKRLFAMIIDLLLTIPIISLVSLLCETVIDYRLNAIDIFNDYAAIIMYLTGAWLFESSSLQATPGKILLGLRVIKKNQDRLGYFHGLLRIGVFAVGCFFAFFTALYNFLSDGRFIHDRLTKSYVMDLWRTRKEQAKNA